MGFDFIFEPKCLDVILMGDQRWGLTFKGLRRCSSVYKFFSNLLAMFSKIGEPKQAFYLRFLTATK